MVKYEDEFDKRVTGFALVVKVTKWDVEFLIIIESLWLT